MMNTPSRELHNYISEIAEQADVRAGSPLPLGTEEKGAGVNFAVFSRNASRVRLELFDHAEDGVPARVIELDSLRNRTGDVWHVWVKGIAPGQLYAYRVDGPYQPREGHRFNVNRLLLDPCATAISRLPPWDCAAARGYDASAPEKDLVLAAEDNSSSMPKCVVVNEPFDWNEDLPPRHPWSKTVIYEVHVRGFTIHPNSGIDHPGTYRGLTEKISYLKTLGVTAVELMPVQEFDSTSARRTNPQTSQPLTNYWGYDPVVFRAPKATRGRRFVSAALITTSSTRWRTPNATTGTTRAPAILSTPIIGENAQSIRARICTGLEVLGVEIDGQGNARNEGVISAAASRVAVRVIQTDEQLMIAETVCRVLGLGEKRGPEP